MATSTTAGSTSPAQTNRFLLIISFLTIYIIWGTTFLGIRIAVQTIPPFLMAGLRFATAGAIMFGLVMARGGKLPTRREWRSSLIAGALMLVGGIGLVSFGEQRVPSALAALMAGTIPAWIILFEWLVFKGKRPGLQTLIGLVLGFGGVVLLFAPAIGGGAAGDLPWLAIVLTGATLFAFGSLYSRRAEMPADTQMGTAAEMLCGGGLLLVLSTITGEPARVDLAAVSPQSWLALIYLIVFGGIISYTAYLWLLRNADPASVSTNFYVNPVVAVIAGWLVLGEQITPTMIAAAAVIVLGVVVITTRLPGSKQGAAS